MRFSFACVIFLRCLEIFILLPYIPYFLCFNLDSFAIDLKPSGSRDVALHLNPRMKEKVFVRNTYLYDSWGEEERQLREFPFFPDMYFEVGWYFFSNTDRCIIRAMKYDINYLSFKLHVRGLETGHVDVQRGYDPRSHILQHVHRTYKLSMSPK